MKTAVQELIDVISSHIAINESIGKIDVNTYRDVINAINALQLLEKEKKQIIDAHESGKRCIAPYPTAEQYYSQTFNQD